MIRSSGGSLTRRSRRTPRCSPLSVIRPGWVLTSCRTSGQSTRVQLGLRSSISQFVDSIVALHTACVRLAQLASIMLLAVGALHGQPPSAVHLGIATYMLEAEPGDADSTFAGLSRVLDFVAADLVLVQGIDSDDFLARVIDSATSIRPEYRAFVSSFTGRRTQLILCDTSRLQCSDGRRFGESGGELDLWQVRVRQTGESFDFYGAVLAEGQDLVARRERNRQAIDVRHENSPARNAILAGALNIADNTESAYVSLLLPGISDDLGQFRDVYSDTRTWNNSPAAARFHNSSSRYAPATGDSGLVARSDFILASRSLSDGGTSWIDSSLSVVGNNGDLYGRSVVDAGNLSTPPVVARALHATSRRLPVMVDIRFAGESPSSVQWITSRWLERMDLR